MDGESYSQDPLKKTLFHHLRERTISKQNEKANVTIDLRQSSLVHMFTAENVVWKNHNNNDEMAQNQISTQEEGSSPLGIRSQTARRGRHFYSQRGTSCCSQVRIQKNDEVVPISQGSFSSSAADGTYSVGSSFGSCQPMGSPEFEPKSRLSCRASHESPFGLGKGQSSVLDLSLLDLVDVSDQNCGNANEMTGSDSSNYNQASTIIHLKVTDADDENVSRDSKFLTASKKSCVITDPTNLNVISEPEKRTGELVEDDKKPSEDDSLVDSDDEDLPLIMHCNRKRRAQASGDDDHSETAMRQEVKRTYQRGNMMHNLSSSSSSRLEDRPPTERPVNYSEKLYAAGGYSTARHAVENSDKSERRFKPKNSAYSNVRHRQRMLLEAYERSNQLLRNTCDIKEATVKKYRCSPKRISGDETIKKLPLRKPASRSMPNIPKSCLIGQLVSGPVSVKRTQMKQLRVNPRMMSRVLRELTARNCPRSRVAATFRCISHQNYYDGCLVYRLTRCLPARERVTVLVPTRALDELDQVSKEVLRLWKLSGSEVEELQKQVKQEMQHKRTEHIMPVLLQMSYEQIESAYEQVKKDMTTYEVTEDDTSDEDGGQEDKEIDDDENRECSVKASRGKESAGENLPEDVDNAGDENLHLTSYEIIVHDESSKTVSCETIEYLEWREKHPVLKNGASKSSKSVSDSNSDRKIYEAGKIIDTVKPTEEAVKQTAYSQSRPKRLAVDYSPSAFAPIRFMEGKRLGGARETPSKHPSKHSPDKKVSKSATPSSHLEKQQNSFPASTTAVRTTQHVSTAQEPTGHANTNGSESSISAILSRNNGRESENMSPSLAESPESPLKLDAAPASETFVVTGEYLAGVKGSGSDNVDAGDFHVNTAIEDADDDVPVIVDMCEMPLALETESSSYVKDFSGDCTGTNGSERTFSAYDAVRNEYVRLRDTMETELSCTMATELSGTMAAAVPGDILQGGSEAGSFGNDAVDDGPGIEGSNLFKGNVNSNLMSLEKKLRSNLFGDMASDPAVEASTKIFDSTTSMPGGKDSGTLASMPQLKLQCSDSCNLEAENPLAPPDLGLPIEYSDIWQHSASPVQPPVLLEEEGPYDTGSNSVELRHPLIL